MLACARGLLSLSLSVIVVDNVEFQRRAAFREVAALAEEARLPLWPAKWPRDAEVRALFTRAAVLAATLFSREWLLAATRATKKARKVDSPSAYWLGALRNGLVEIEGFPKFPDRAEQASYFSQLMQTAAAAAAEIIAHCGDQRSTEPALVPAKRQASQEDARGAGGEDQGRLRRAAAPT